MRVCKICGASEGRVRWVTKRGKAEGLTCASCHSKTESKRMQSPEWAERYRARLKAYRTQNSEKVKSLTRAWVEQNRERVNLAAANRHTAKLNRVPKWVSSEEQEFFIVETYALAVLRTKMLGVGYAVDHRIPLQGKLASGLHVWQNLQVITARKNSSKGNKYEIA